MDYKTNLRPRLMEDISDINEVNDGEEDEEDTKLGKDVEMEGQNEEDIEFGEFVGYDEDENTLIQEINPKLQEIFNNISNDDENFDFDFEKTVNILQTYKDKAQQLDDKKREEILLNLYPFLFQNS